MSMHPFILLLMLTLKILSSFHTMGLEGANNDEELYHNCWLNKWECNHADPKQWVEIFSITLFFRLEAI